MLSLDTLHYDAIQAIISFLDSRDALNLARTSRSFYDLAINQASASVYCTFPRKLLAAWDILARKHPDRARHVRVLRAGSIDPHAAEFVDAERDPYALYRDLLLQAQNTSCIFLRGASLMENQGVSAAIQALRHLVHLDLFGGYDSRTLAVIEAIRSPLQVLSLRAHEKRASPLLDVLVSLAPHQASLRALRMTGRSHLPHLSLDKIDRPPRFPLCRRLILAQLYYHTSVDIFATFSNIEVMYFPHIRLQPTRDKVPPLRHLQLHAAKVAQLAGRFSGTRYLHLVNGVVLVEGSGPTLQITLDAVREVSPVALHLDVISHSANAKMVAFWDGLAAVAPRMRCLDLFLEPGSSYTRSNVGNVYEEIALWMRNLSFRSDDTSLPLRCLRVAISFRTAFDISLRSRPWFDGEQPAEEERPVADAIRGLPETIASAIPTLQYLAISTQADYYSIVMEDWYNDESDYDLHALDADITWWHIERGDGRQIFYRMGMTEGERLWRSLIEKDDES